MPATANNRQELRMLMVEHDLQAEDVSPIIGKSVATIHMYMSKSDERNISDDDLDTLRAHLSGKG